MRELCPILAVLGLVVFAIVCAVGTGFAVGIVMGPYAGLVAILTLSVSVITASLGGKVPPFAITVVAFACRLDFKGDRI